MFKGLLIFFIGCSAAFALELTSSVFDRLDRDELVRLYGELLSKPASSFSAQLDLALVRYFLAEAAALRFEVGTAEDFLSDTLTFCAEHETRRFQDGGDASAPSRLKSRSAFLCALAETERINRQSPYLQFSTAQRIQNNLQVGKENDPDPDELLYTEGRVFGALPAAWGQNFRRSLVALTLLSRRRSDLSSIPFLLGRTYYWQGNVARAQVLLSDGQNGRSPFFYKDGEFVEEQSHNDGVLRGLYPGLFYSVAQGAGAQIIWAENWQASTSLKARVAVATRPLFDAGARLSHWARRPGTQVGYELEVTAFFGQEDFYGLGTSTPFDGRSQWTAFRNHLRAMALFSPANHFYVKAGIEAHITNLSNVTGQAFTLLPFSNTEMAQGFGPAIELVWDTRDSAESPRSGSLIHLYEFAALSALGSPRVYEESRLELSHFERLTNQHSVGIHLIGDMMSDEVPLGAYPRVVGTVGLPAIRDNRYTDRSVLAGYLDYTGRIWGPLQLIAFLSALQMGADISTLWNNPIAWGGGGGVDLDLTRFRADHVRLEAGVFNGEFSFRAFGGKRF